MLRIAQRVVQLPKTLPVYTRYHHSSPYDHIIRIGKHTFEPVKMLNITARPSRIYLRYPYVLNIRYNEPSEDLMMIPAGHGTMIPMWLDDDHTDYSYKYETKEAIKKIIDEIRTKAPDCRIYDNV